MADRHLDVVEENRPAANGTLAGILETGSADARQVHGHQKSADAAGALLHGAGAGEDHGDIRLIGHGDRRFLAVEHIDVAFEFGLQAQAGSVGPAAGFGQGNTGDLAPGRHFAQPFPGERGFGVLGDDLAVQRRQQWDVRDVEVATGQFFDDQAGGDTVQAAAAELLRQFATKQAHFAHLGNDFALDAAVAIPLAVTGGEDVSAESCNAVADGILLFCECEIHDALQAIRVLNRQRHGCRRRDHL